MTAALAYRLRLAVAALIALVGVGGAVALAVPISFPLGSYRGPIPLAAVSEARADAALAKSPPDLRGARDETLETLSVRPMDATAWGRLAWLADQEGHRNEMLDALDRSYSVAPFGPDVTGWRLRFAFGHWSTLTPDLRRQVLNELAEARRDRPGVVTAARADVTDPAGRLAFDLATSIPAKPEV